MIVWMLEGPKAGTFVPVSVSEGKELISEGRAQSATGNAHLMRRPGYKTREMRPEKPVQAVEVVQTAEPDDDLDELLILDDPDLDEKPKPKQQPPKSKKNRGKRSKGNSQ